MASGQDTVWIECPECDSELKASKQDPWVHCPYCSTDVHLEDLEEWL